MSDSDDDWFEKDVDEMVQEVQNKNKPQELSSSKYGENPDSINPSEQSTSRTPFQTDQDYGGSYDIKAVGSKDKKCSDSKRKMEKGEAYIQRISGKKLKILSKQDALEIFLEIYQTDCGFFECLEESISNEHIRLVIEIFAKICLLPFQAYARDYLLKFLNAPGLFSQLESFFRKEPYSPDVVEKFMVISWKIESLGIGNENVVSTLNHIKKKCGKNDKQSAEIQNLLNAFDGEKEVHAEIYPSPEDLTLNEPVEVKPNIVKGKYPSVQEYIRTHLSLLREDFVEPLREYIRELKKFESIDKCNSSKSSFLVDLKPNERSTELEETNKTPWINSKKLMYGTLLCFTSSLELTDLILAVVSYRDIDILAKGYIYVEIVKMYNASNIFNREFIMFENEVYFEPYHHVYRVFRGLHEGNFPLKNYIVQVEPNSHPPDYLTSSKKVNYKYKNYHFNPLDSSTFPSADLLDLDLTQYAAFQQSLSRKFSLIQGPPGTGKTFIGLKIVSTLLKNLDAQILVICYTNHALDQFLLGILQSTKDIVRLGSQSKHEKLDEYNIKQITDGGIASRNLKAVYYNAKTSYSKLIEEFERLQRVANDGEGYEQIIKKLDELQQASAKLDELKQIFDLKIVKNKKVIGMTTTYASRSNLLLQLLKTPIVIVEEAAEILEPHIVASLTQSTEHVILIGDHQQLRPTTSVYRLSEKFKMDISLFERMINNNLNCVCMDTQHRMRPEIADLLRPTIYKNLLDAPNVQTYGNVRGMTKNMFFINHNVMELKSSDETTKRNSHEVYFLFTLAEHLLTHDYKPEEIVILCTYNGQMFEFFSERKRFPRLEKLRITVVDNFQGEESKIILLSLVRNNKDNRIGYLAMKNRICVALSRAQEGFYVAGAIDFLAKNNSTWRDIKATLERHEAVGDKLSLICSSHGNVIEVQSADDIRSVTLGKCCRKSHKQIDSIL